MLKNSNGKGGQNAWADGFKQRDGKSGKNQKLMLEMKNTVTEVKNAFWLISRLDWAKEAVSELADLD